MPSELEQPQQHPDLIIDSLRWAKGDKGGTGPRSALIKGRSFQSFLSLKLALEDLHSSPSLDDTFPLLFSKRVLILLFRTARDTDYLLITEDVQEYGCGCCSIGVGELD